MTSTVPPNLEKKKGRIVFAWNYVPWGGAQVYLLAVMKLAKKDWDMRVVLPESSNPEIIRYLEQLGVEYITIPHHLDIEPAPTIKRKLERQFNRLRAEYHMFRELKKFDVRDTVFQLDIAPWQSVTFLSAMSLRGARAFITLHNFLTDTGDYRMWIWKSRFRYVSHLAGINFFTSNVDTKRRLKGWVNDRFWDRIKVTFTAVNPPEIAEAAAADFDTQATLERLGVDADDFIVLCVGNFVDRKGRWVFLDAAQRVVQTHDDVSFLWLTPQLPTEKEKERIDGYGLGSKFRLVHAEELGKDRIDVLKFFRVADVFALPSFIEGLPIALLEAMALERPSISTNIFAVPEAIRDHDTGILIEAGDPDALARAVIELKNDPELRRRLAKNGREHVLASFDERDAAAAVIASYTEALNRGR